MFSNEIKNLMAVYREAEDLINIGAYSRGSNKNIDRAWDKIEQINNFLRQSTHDKVEIEEVQELMRSIVS